ncbi:MAG: DUF4845 domain-containing protein [Oleiphilaceae bacterium]|nr:DUF4845 domain-containing protein [Oleiphilaceae bacterium]
MQTLTKQKGISPVGWFLILCLIGLFLIFVIKSFTVYMSHYQLYQALEWAGEQPEFARASPGEIRKRLGRKFDTGYVSHVSAKDLKIKRKPKGVRTIGIDYEVRKPLFYNIDLVYKFDTEVELPRDQSGSE